MTEKTFAKVDKKILLATLQFILFVAIAVVAPLTNQQFVTGSIVNATLFISVTTLGISPAIMIGLIPSVFALSSGLLPTVLAPMVPFIILGNTLLILVFSLVHKRSAVFGVVVASVIKFVFLYTTSSIVINLLLKKTLAEQVALMMSWPQLLTALIGGAVALVFLHFVNKR